MTEPEADDTVDAVDADDTVNADDADDTDDTIADVRPLAAIEVPWRRLSPRMLLIHPIREVGRTAPGLIAILLAGRSSGHFHWWSFGAIALVILLSVSRWYTTRYQITADQVQLRTGLFRKRTITTTADRVRTVDVTAHLLHRLLGLARVAIGTGTSDRKREGLILDGLSADAASRLRAELLHRVARPSPTAVPGFTEAPTSEQQTAQQLATQQPATEPWTAHQPATEQPIAELDPSWIRFAPFTLSGAVTALAILGFGWRIIDQAHVDAGRASAVHSIAGHLRDTPLWLDVLQITIGILAVVALLSILGYVLAFWNFRLTRHPGGSLNVSRGLITTRATSIEERRLRGVELSELLVLRAVGGARLLAVATGLRVGRGSERGGTLLLPACPRAEAHRVAAVVLQAPDLVQAELRSHGSIARRRRLNRTLIPALVLAIAVVAGWQWANLPGWLAAAALTLPVFAILLALDRYRSLGHAFLDGYLLTQFGSLNRRRVILQADAVIGWNLRQTWLQRRAGVTTLTATTAAGKQVYQITDLDHRVATTLADTVVPNLLDEFIVSPQ